MSHFKNSYDSHEHSQEILNMVYGYDSFLDSLTVIADMGCGAGYDANWWATLMTRDDPPEPRDYIVYAIDKDISKIEPDFKKNENFVPFEADFEEHMDMRTLDLIWSHDSFQYAKNPMQCLANWKRMLQVNGMLIMAVPQTTYICNSRLVSNVHHNQYFNYNILTLMYMLAANGFDCRDAYFYRKENTPWLYAAVYASEHDPIDGHCTWYDLADKNLINDSVINSVNKYGHARLEDVVVSWFDKNLYKITS